MATDISICNIALAHIGKQPINAFDERSTEARTCKAVYDQARRSMLEMSEWTFGKKREALAEVVNDYPARWAFSYVLPVDSLKLLRVIGDLDTRFDPTPVEFEVREGKVYTMLSPAVGEYVFDQTNVSRFSPLFIDALAYHIAAYIARPLTRSPKMVQEMKDERSRALSLAIESDAAQDVQRYAFEPDSLIVRN